MNESTPASGEPVTQRELPNATAALVLGILSIVFCMCYGLPGLILSIIGLWLSTKDMKSYQQAPERYTRASYNNLSAGRTCSIIGLVLSGVSVLMMVLYFLFHISMVANPWTF